MVLFRFKLLVIQCALNHRSNLKALELLGFGRFDGPEL